MEMPRSRTLPNLLDEIATPRRAARRQGRAALVGVPNEQTAVGMPVEVVFDDVTREITLPGFRRTT